MLTDDTWTKSKAAFLSMHQHCVMQLIDSFTINYFFLQQSGQFSEDMIPTVGFNMRKITKGNVTIKVLVVFPVACSFKQLK